VSQGQPAESRNARKALPQRQRQRKNRKIWKMGIKNERNKTAAERKALCLGTLHNVLAKTANP